MHLVVESPFTNPGFYLISVCSFGKELTLEVFDQVVSRVELTNQVVQSLFVI